jgi:hypothetical protein
MVIFEQMALDLMGVNVNAYEDHFGGLSEDAVKEFYIRSNMTSLTRTLLQKIKYVKYMGGDMDAAAKHYDLLQQQNSNCAVRDTTGEFNLLVSLESVLLLF